MHIERKFGHWLLGIFGQKVIDMAVWVAGMPSEVELKEGLVVIGCRCPEAISSVTTWELKRFKRIDRCACS